MPFVFVFLCIGELLHDIEVASDSDVTEEEWMSWNVSVALHANILDEDSLTLFRNAGGRYKSRLLDLFTEKKRDKKNKCYTLWT